VDYNEIKAVNWSTLKHIGVSPKYYRYRLENPEPETAAMRLGTAVHCAVLEPNVFVNTYATAPEVDRRTKAGKAAYDAAVQAAVGRTLLSASKCDTVTRIASAVHAHAPAAALLRDAPEREQTITWTDARTGLACKGRVDAIGNDRMVSLKTTRAPTPEAFARAAIFHQYHGQAAFYIEGTGLSEVVIVAQSVEPYDVWVLEWPQEIIDVGHDLCAELLDTLAHCRASDEWPGAVPGTMTMPVPSWAMPREDDDLAELGLE